jgi:hypothetical protein
LPQTQDNGDARATVVKLSLLTRTTSLIGLSFAVVAGVSFVANVTSAQFPDEAVRFHYRAPAGCPDAELFASRVQARTGRARLGEPGELARLFVVEVEVDAQGAGARLSFTDSRGASVVRAVRGETCDEVVSAIALVTALAIEAGPSEPGASAPPKESSPNAATAPKLEASPKPPSSRTLRTPEPDTLAWSIGVEGSMSSWLGPGLSLGVGLFGEVGTYAGPSGRITLLRATSHALVEHRDRPSVFRPADFTAYLARVGGCPLALGLGSGFRVLPCASLGLGQLEGEGQESEGLSPGRSGAILWADALAELRLDWTLSDSLVFSAEGELGVPLLEHRFRFRGPTQHVFVVPDVGGGGALGVAWRFP